MYGQTWRLVLVFGLIVQIFKNEETCIQDCFYLQVADPLADPSIIVSLTSWEEDKEQRGQLGSCVWTECVWQTDGTK